VPGVGWDHSFLGGKHLGPPWDQSHMETTWEDASFRHRLSQPRRDLRGCGVERTGSYPVKEQGREVGQIYILPSRPCNCFCWSWCPLCILRMGNQNCDSPQVQLASILASQECRVILLMHPSHPFDMLCYFSFHYHSPTKWSG